jgi:Trk K+ transport system NAD-binding subunit
VTISSRMLAAEAILRFVRKGDVIDVALLASGAEMIELRVPECCRVAGRPLSEVGFPDAIVGAQLRDGASSSRRARKYFGPETTWSCSPSRTPWKRSRTSSPPD